MKIYIRRIASLILAASIIVSQSVVLINAETESTSETDVIVNCHNITKIVNSMNLDEKITQTFMMDFRKWGYDESGSAVPMTELNSEVSEILKNYKFGSIILFSNNLSTTEQTLKLTKNMQAATISDGGLPLLIATDQEGGVVARLGTGTALPGNMAVAATGDINNALISGQIIGRELSCLGINTTLAPVVDVNSNPNNPVIGIRSFGEDANLVGQYGSAFISGLDEYNVIGCAKHYPGHGDTATDSHYGLPIVDKSYDELKEQDLLPFSIAINQGIDMIMTAHILYPQLDSTTIHSDKTGNEESRPATLSNKIITDLLKGTMGFEGVVATDGMNMEGITNSFDETQATVEALKAGVDLVCMPATGIYSMSDMSRVDAIIQAVKDAVDSGDLPIERLDDAVTRVLTLKAKKGILDYDESYYPLDKALATVGSEENKNLESEIADEAVTLIKDDDNQIPHRFKSGEKVLYLCPYNNEKALMALAWNRLKKEGYLPDDAELEIYNFKSDDCEVVGTLKDKIDWADTIIVVSEISKPSAASADSWLRKGPSNFVSYAEANDKFSVVLSVETPYDAQFYGNADAVLAVYGDKGSNSDPTEILEEGDVTTSQLYGPNIIAGIEAIGGMTAIAGKLPVTITKFDDTTNLYTDEVLYERGYGLTRVMLEPISNKSDVDTADCNNIALYIIMLIIAFAVASTVYNKMSSIES